MKLKISLTKICLVAGLLIFNSAYGQFGGVGDMSILIRNQKSDATSLLKSYLTPFGNGFTAGMNGGWYNTAKVHKTLGFDITVTANLASVPSSDQSFDVSKLGLHYSQLNGDPTAQTIAGKDIEGPELVYSQPVGPQSYEYARFRTPQGSNFSYVPAPTVQLSIGTIKNTDLLIRFMPKVSLGDAGSIGLWGVGVKHSIKQWIPGLSLAKVFNLSALIAYNKLTTSAELDVDPIKTYESMYNGTTFTQGNITPSLYTGQETSLTFSGLHVGVIGSIDIPVISVYAGLGITKSTAKLKLKGNYPFAGPNNTSTGLMVDDKYMMTDPLNVDLAESSIKPRLTAGLKLKLAIFTIHADYTLATYSVVSAGFGLSIR